MRTNNKKRWMAFIMAGILAVGGLTACGKSNIDSDDKKEGSKEEKQIVSVWSATFDTDEEIKIFQEAFGKTELSKSIEVKFTEVPSGTNQEKADKLLVSLIGGEDIDIFDANLAEYFNYAIKGVLEPLDEYIKKDNYDLMTLGEDNVSLSKINDKLYGLPYIQSSWIMYYNKNLFDEAGIDYPTNDMTWDEFRETAKKLTKGEGTNKQWGFTMADWACTWAGIATQAGAKFVNDDGTTNLEDDRFKDALKFKYDLTMVDKSGPSFAENKLTKAHYAKLFSAGNIAMMPAGDWVHQNIKDNLSGEYPFEYDVAYIPHPEGVDSGTTYGAPRYIGINAKQADEDKAAAWEVMKFLTSEEVANMFVESCGTLPAASFPSTIELYKKSLPEFVKNGAIVFDKHKQVEEKPYHVAAGPIDSVMGQESELYLTGSKSLEDTIKDMNKRAQEEVDKVMKELK